MLHIVSTRNALIWQRNAVLTAFPYLLSIQTRPEIGVHESSSDWFLAKVTPVGYI